MNDEVRALSTRSVASTERQHWYLYTAPLKRQPNGRLMNMNYCCPAVRTGRGIGRGTNRQLPSVARTVRTVDPVEEAQLTSGQAGVKSVQS